VHSVSSGTESAQHAARVDLVVWLSKDLAIEVDGGVSTKNDVVAPSLLSHSGLLTSETFYIRNRILPD
jgi:hypothetical protein